MRFFLFTLVIFLVTQSSRAELRDENLLQNLPSGYRIAFETKKGNMLLTEMVPQNETVNNWTEMLTTQVFLSLKSATPQQFRDFMQKQWPVSCKGGESASIAEGNENGYPFTVWIQACPLNQVTGKPEKIWFKAIKGTDSFYLVQKAFRFEPSEEEITKWVQYLKSVRVCDTRLVDRPCPILEKLSQ